LLLRNPIRGGQGPNWAVAPYDDEETRKKERQKDEKQTYKQTKEHEYTQRIKEMCLMRNLRAGRHGNVSNVFP
jgi:hypothetical protein